MCRIAATNDVYPGGWVSPAAYYSSFPPKLAYVPDNLKTGELGLAAVAQNWCALKYVPESLKTVEMCRKAMLTNDSAKAFVPSVLLPACSIAVKVAELADDTLTLTDEKGVVKQIHPSLLSANDLSVIDGTVAISPSLYKAWFTASKRD
jgi:hypothetical protein